MLECVEVTKRFGGITAVDAVDLELRKGQILGLIGQNGAGKTTLLDCVSGFLAIDGGRVTAAGPRRHATGPPTTGPPTGWAARSRTPACSRRSPSPRRSPWPSSATCSHATCVAAALHLPAAYESELAATERVDELIELMGLGAFREKLVSELSTGSRRIVDLACILAQDPSVLLLDEPSSGVAQRETEALAPLLLRVRDHTGCSLLVIEHDMPLLVVDLRRDGRARAGRRHRPGTPTEVLEHPRVIESYLGTDERSSSARERTTNASARR